jgi:tripartite motif-containing protein 71
MPSRDDVKTVVIAGRRYPLAAVVERSQLGIFDRKFIVGDAQFDSDSYQSAAIYSNLSGGIGIEDSDEGADATRFWFGVMDTRSPRMIGLPPLVNTPAPPQAGAARPLGVIGTQFYMCFDDDAYGWNDASNGWHVTVNDLDFAPVNKPVAFDGRVWIPQGANGIRAVTETTPNNGTLTEALITATPEAAGLAIWNNTLYAIATDGDLWRLNQGSTTWAVVANSAGTTLRINTSETPKNLCTYFNRLGEPTLWLVTDRAAYQLYEQAVEWRPSNIIWPPHQDFGRAVAVWRTGEDLWITAGLDIVRMTTGNALVPLASGVSRDQGVPQGYRGTILDICPEISHLYALVGSGTAASSYSFDDTVGAAGTGDGQFADVRGLSVDSAGSVFACDENNERIQEFDSSLTYVAKFGSSGTGNGQFAADNGPYDCAHDSGDALFVVDRGNSRVQKFTAGNAYSSQFGSFDDGTAAVAGSETWGLTNTYGSSGSGNDNFNNPRQVAVDSAGATYTADGNNDRLIKRNSSGVYVSQITGLTAITGVAIDASDNLYVVYDTAAVRKYNSSHVLQWTQSVIGTTLEQCATDGTHLYVTDRVADVVRKRLCSSGASAGTALGSSGSGNGQFNSPFGITTDGTYLWVVDQDNSRVQQLTTGGVYVAQFAIPAGCRGIARLASGHLLVANTNNTLVNRYSSSGTLVDTFAQTAPRGIAVASDGSVWVTNASGDTLAEWDLAVVGAVAAIPPANGSFNLPEGIAIKSSSGRIYVADTGNHRVQYFTSSGVYEGTIGANTHSTTTGAMVASSDTGSFDTPTAISLSQSSGDVYVLDTGNDRVQQFTATGSFIRAWGSTGTGPGQLTTPTALVVSPATGNILVADSTRDDVQEFSTGGAFLRKFGSTGTADGEFTAPSGLATNAAGTSIYVADSGNEDIQEFVEATGSVEPALPTLHAWPGTGWHCLWEGSETTTVPTWAMASAPTTHYRLWWGDTDGTAYWMKLFRGFENPNQGRLAQSAEFAASGYLLTSKFDAGMLGFRKVASHVTIIPILDSITADETVLVEFEIDDGGWESLGTVSATTLGTGNSVTLSFGAAGRAFQTIRLRLTGARGSFTSRSPFLRSFTLFFVKVPQAARSFIFTIQPNASEIGAYGNRTGFDMFAELDDLADADDFFSVTYNGQTFAHCRFAGSTGHDNLVEATGVRTVSIIELPVPA